MTSRTFEVAGQKLTIETGVELPNHRVARPKGPIRLIAEQLKDGESVLIPTTPQAIQDANIYNMASDLGCKLSYRTEEGGVRLFRLPLATMPRVKAKRAERQETVFIT